MSPPRSDARSSRRARNSLEPVSVSSARLTLVNLAQPLLQRLELCPEGLSHPAAEAREVGLRLVEPGTRLAEVDAQRLSHRVAVEPAELEVLRSRDVADRRLHRVAL